MIDHLYRLAVTLEQSDVPGVHKIEGSEVLANGLNLVYFVAGIAAVVIIIVGGIMYSTSGGDSGAVTKAKNLILYAIIGLVIILAAFAITGFVRGRF